MGIKVTQKLMAHSTDRARFIDTVIELATLGAKRYGTTLPKLSPPLYSLEMEISVDSDKQITSTAFYKAFKADPLRTYSEQALKEMVWEEFRTACSSVGVKGRDRTKMLEEYLEAVKNLSE